jgi:hypothetical protein
MLTNKERIGALEAQIGQLRARLDKLEGKSAEPAHPTKPPVPIYRNIPLEGNPHTGLHLNEPTPQYIAEAAASAKAPALKPGEKPDGTWKDGALTRDREGNIVTTTPTTPPPGPERSPQHAKSIDLLDNMLPLQGGR